MADKTLSTQPNDITVQPDYNLTRRDFLKTSALVGGVAAVSGGLYWQASQPTAASSPNTT